MEKADQALKRWAEYIAWIQEMEYHLSILIEQGKDDYVGYYAGPEE